MTREPHLPHPIEDMEEAAQGQDLYQAPGAPTSA